MVADLWHAPAPKNGQAVGTNTIGSSEALSLIHIFNLGIGKDLGLFGAFSFDITQANTTLADDTRHSGQSVNDKVILCQPDAEPGCCRLRV